MREEIRDYLAAHAPTEIPNWFEWQPAWECPNIPCKHELDNVEMRSQLEGLGDWLDEKDAHPAVVELANRMASARDALQQWNKEQTIGRYIAWRWAYADMMIAARQKAED